VPALHAPEEQGRGLIRGPGLDFIKVSHPVRTGRAPRVGFLDMRPGLVATQDVVQRFALDRRGLHDGARDGERVRTCLAVEEEQAVVARGFGAAVGAD